MMKNQNMILEEGLHKFSEGQFVCFIRKARSEYFVIQQKQWSENDNLLSSREIRRIYFTFGFMKLKKLWWTDKDVTNNINMNVFTRTQ